MKTSYANKNISIPSMQSNNWACVIPKKLYIGNHISAIDRNFLVPEGITHIVCCATELNGMTKYPNIKYLNLNLNDQINDNLTHCLAPTYEFIDKAINNGGSVLVHCHAGISRSASIVLFYLMKSTGLNYDTCLNYLRKKRSIVRPNAGYDRQLRQLDEKIFIR